jgi:subtilisin-like proprotein convertase family protein
MPEIVAASETLPAAIAGVIWHDRNANTSIDTIEPTLANWTVYLDQNQNGQPDGDEPITVTDVTGDYQFSNLPADTYHVAIALPSGWEQTTPANRFEGSANSGRSSDAAAPQLSVNQLPQQDEISVASVNAEPAKAISQTSDHQVSLVRVSRNALPNQAVSNTPPLSEPITDWIVGLAKGVDSNALAQAWGATSLRPTGHIPNTYVWQFDTPIASVPAQWSTLPEIELAFPLVIRQSQPRSAGRGDRSSLDYSTATNQSDPLFAQQWHLRNTGQSGGTPGADANVEPVWNLAVGADIVIAIVDDGLQYTHPDLASQYRPELSFDFNGNDTDPLPDSALQSHGTSVAGVAVSRGQNGIGGSGSAPGALLAGLRLTAGFVTDLDEADALVYNNQDIDIYNNSWGPTDDGQRLEGPGPLTRAALENGVTTGRGGLGNIYVWAAGNGLESDDNVNYDGYANSRYTIAVSAIDHKGVQSDYSERGAPILVAAYSSGDNVGITTTDLIGADGINPDGDYTDSFGGTSSATPLVSGVIALMLEANPNLTWRDVQHILVTTAEKTDPSDDEWTLNGANRWVNHKYGFGAIDAAAAVNAAIDWVSVAPEVELTSGAIALNATIPDNDPVGFSSTVNIGDNISLEWVEVVFDADHNYRGDLNLTLTSPDGTQSILAETRSDSNADIDNWTFTSARHWGESSGGNWTLTVADGFDGDSGIWNSWQLNLYGTRSEDANSPDVSQVTHTVTLGSGDRATGLDFGLVNQGGEPNDTLATAIATGFSSASSRPFTYSGQLGDAPQLTPGQDVDLFELQLERGDAIAIDLDTDSTNALLDTLIRVFDATGNEMAVNDTGGAPGEVSRTDSFLRFIAPATNRYYIGVSDRGNDYYRPEQAGSGGGAGNSGGYMLEIRPDSTPEVAEPNDTIAQAVDSGLSSANPGIVSFGGTIGNNANLYITDDVDMYRVEMTAGDRLMVDLDSSALGSSLDGLLQIFDAAGSGWALSDDDAAPGEVSSFDSYLEFTAEQTGTYYVGVSSYQSVPYDPKIEGSGQGISDGIYELVLELTPAVRSPLEGTAQADRFSITQSGMTVLGRGGNDVINAVQSDGGNWLKGNAGRDRIKGNRGDRLIGGLGNDHLDVSHGRGSNHLRGGGGKDRLYAGVGDRLYGNGGDDLLYGGQGDNYLKGGNGNDQFWLMTEGVPIRPDIIVDFKAGRDVIGIGDRSTTYDDLTFTREPGRTVIQGLGSEIAHVLGVRPRALTEDSFVFA